jgi:hypothetical protein
MFKSFLQTIWFRGLTRLPSDLESAIQIHWQARQFVVFLEPAMKKEFAAPAKES